MSCSFAVGDVFLSFDDVEFVHVKLKMARIIKKFMVHQGFSEPADFDAVLNKINDRKLKSLYHSHSRKMGNVGTGALVRGAHLNLPGAARDAARLYVASGSRAKIEEEAMRRGLDLRGVGVDRTSRKRHYVVGAVKGCVRGLMPI